MIYILMVLGRNYENENETRQEDDDETCERVLQTLFDVISLFAGATNMSQSANTERVTRNLKVTFHD